MRLVDVSLIETPKQEIGNIQLEQAQRERNSFLEELKKASFIISEHSTHKIEVKESMILGEHSKQEKKSFDLQ